MATDSIAAAVRVLAAGEVVGFPTETVYGLGADATRPEAVAKIFLRKGRPQDHPLIVHIARPSQLGAWAIELSPTALLLARQFWPGPLTLILKRAPRVLDAVTGGQATVGLRCPAHPLAAALLSACFEAGIPGLAAPSANRFGRISPTTAEHVRAEFGPDLMVLDGGACQVGIESTIVDVSSPRVRILRPGMISEAAISAVLNTALAAPGMDIPRVSGSLAAHYAPSTPLKIVTSSALSDEIDALLSRGFSVVVIGSGVHERACIKTIVMPNTAIAYAQCLYSSLREADHLSVDRILLEAPPATAEWFAIYDRLQRAAAQSVID